MINIRAIVFKMPRLNESRTFFKNIHAFQFAESSARHFVIVISNIRFVFIETSGDLEIEIYLRGNGRGRVKKEETFMEGNAAKFQTLREPNGITIIIT
jgi:hypothetical protein